MVRVARWTGLLLVSAAGCSPPNVEPKNADSDAIQRGKTVAVELGCAVCHDFADIEWPKGRVGPRLHDFANQAFIAGTIPNTPQALTDFLLDPRAISPQSSMPAMAMTPQNARDLAAWLHSMRADKPKGSAR